MNVNGVIVGTLASIWRYPVKSLQYEAVDAVEVDAGGLQGDRTSAYVVCSAGHARSGKTYRGKENDRLHLATRDEEVRSLASARNVDVALAQGQRFFDDAPVSLLVDRWLEDLSAHVGYAVEPLRFRPNFFVTAAPEFRDPESSLEGRTLAVGTAVLRVRYPIERCVVTTYDPRGGASDARILRYVAQHRNAWMGVYCDVLEPGTARTGDVVTSQ